MVFQLLGAVVGAGFASGREIASFFGQYGSWALGCIAIAVAVMVFLADVQPRGSFSAPWWMLSRLLLIVTGGAMLSGAGHLAELTLPLHAARGIGVLLAAMVGWRLARQDKGLIWVGWLLMAVLLVLMLSGFVIPPMQAVFVEPVQPASGILRAACYGGFSAALMHPLLMTFPLPSRKKGLVGVAVTMALLLLLGCGVMARHPALLAAEMPFVVLARQAGKAGFVLAAASIALGTVSTLAVCIRSIPGRFPLAVMLLISTMGFSEAVGILYSILGGVCAVMLLLCKMTKICGNAFISRKSML